MNKLLSSITKLKIFFFFRFFRISNRSFRIIKIKSKKKNNDVKIKNEKSIKNEKLNSKLKSN